MLGSVHLGLGRAEIAVFGDMRGRINKPKLNAIAARFAGLDLFTLHGHYSRALFFRITASVESLINSGTRDDLPTTQEKFFVSVVRRFLRKLKDFRFAIFHAV